MKRTPHQTVDAPSISTSERSRAAMHKKRRLEWFGTISLLLASIIWGAAFVAQSIGMEHIEPFTFNAIRSLVGACALAVLILVVSLWKRSHGGRETTEKGSARDLWVGGILCGLALTLASNLQQFGIAMTTVGKSGFLTALYIIEVPIFGLLFGKRVKPLIWGCVGLAVGGMYLLCIHENFALELGDLLVFLSSIAFSMHIMVIDIFAPKVDSVRLSCIQFLVAGVLSLIPMLIFEEPNLSSILLAAVPILYAGIMSSGVAFTLQIVGQKWVSPSVTTLLMSLESVFALVFGMIILHDIPSVREGIGAFLVFLAIILAQLDVTKKKKRKYEGESSPEA